MNPNAPSLQLPALGLDEILLALVLGAALSSLTAWQYVRYGRTLSNRVPLAFTLPIVTLTIVLIISVVRASIALSLGLVGALSIVRFRTPVREAEELAYLFIAVGIGIGLGANQVLPTLAATLFILMVATARKFLWGRVSQRNLYLNVEVQDSPEPGEQAFQRALASLGAHVEAADLKRLDVAGTSLQAALSVKVADDRALAEAIAALRRDLKGTVTVTFIDQENTGVSW